MEQPPRPSDDNELPPDFERVTAEAWLDDAADSMEGDLYISTLSSRVHLQPLYNSYRTRMDEADETERAAIEQHFKVEAQTALSSDPNVVIKHEMMQDIRHSIEQGEPEGRALAVELTYLRAIAEGYGEAMDQLAIHQVTALWAVYGARRPVEEPHRRPPAPGETPDVQAIEADMSLAAAEWQFAASGSGEVGEQVVAGFNRIMSDEGRVLAGWHVGLLQAWMGQRLRQSQAPEEVVVQQVLAMDTLMAMGDDKI
jgi:hypothetical protein